MIFTLEVYRDELGVLCGLDVLSIKTGDEFITVEMINDVDEMIVSELDIFADGILESIGRCMILKVEVYFYQMDGMYGTNPYIANVVEFVSDFPPGYFIYEIGFDHPGDITEDIPF